MDRPEFASAISTVVLAAILSLSVYAFSKALAARRVIWNIQKARLPMPKHSTLMGHLLLLKKLMDGLPVDCAIKRNCLGQSLALMELKVVLAMTIREFSISPAYEEWDRRHRVTRIRTVYGNRAYQVEGGGGGAHPSDRYPCRVRLSTE